MKRPNFLRDDIGAVTVDFVVLLATTVTVSLSVLHTLGVSVVTLADETSTYVSDIDIDNRTATLSGGSGTDDSANGTGDDGGSTPEDGSEDDKERDHKDGQGRDKDRAESLGNPGNDKDVGRAGENPNGRVGQGQGERTRNRRQ